MVLWFRLSAYSGRDKPGSAPAALPFCSIAREKILDKGEAVMSMESMIVTVSPDRLRELQDLPVTPAHMAYRMGKGLSLIHI